MQRRKIILTRLKKKKNKVVLNTPSALTMGCRFKNTSPVTESAFVAIFARNFRHRDVFDDFNYNEKRKPSKRLSLQR